jgi:hypothetical protein
VLRQSNCLLRSRNVISQALRCDGLVHCCRRGRHFRQLVGSQRYLLAIGAETMPNLCFQQFVPALSQLGEVSLVVGGCFWCWWRRQQSCQRTLHLVVNLCVPRNNAQTRKQA